MSTPWAVSYVVLWMFVLLQALLVFFLYHHYGVASRNRAQYIGESGLPKGRAAPNATFHELSGEPLQIPRRENPRPAMLFFGSRRCDICRVMAPTVARLSDEFKGRVDVYFVLDEVPEGARAAARGMDRSLHVLASTDAMDAYDIRVTPFVFVLTADGVIVGKGLGSSEANLRGHLRALGHGSPDSGTGLHSIPVRVADGLGSGGARHG